MKILFLCGSQDRDYLQDAIFHGLVELLGWENVRDHPENFAYHEGARPDTPFAPFFFGHPRHAARELDDLIDDSDAVVVGSLQPGVLPSVRRLLTRPRRPPVALVDGADDPYVRVVADYVDAYFKREVLDVRATERAAILARRRIAALRARRRGTDPLLRPAGVALGGGAKAIPLQFAIVPLDVPPPSTSTDVAFLAHPNTAERVQLGGEVAALSASGIAVDTLHGFENLPWAEYMARTSRSRIAISLRGHGRSTVRYFEIPYAGALLLSEPTGVVVPHDFTDGVDAVFAARANLVQRARELLREPERVAEIAGRGRERVLSHHLSVHRAQAVLDHLARARRARVLDR